MATQAKRKSTRKSAEPPLRILCFGDSLTCGYPVDNPYAAKLAQKIEEAFPGRKVECEVEGMPGDLVTTGLFLNRMQMSCRCPLFLYFFYFFILTAALSTSSHLVVIPHGIQTEPWVI